jgi:signal transduction histidine kinase
MLFGDGHKVAQMTEFHRAYYIFTQKDGLSADLVWCAYEDREGNVWIGTTAGLDCFSESKVTPISVREGLLFDHNLELQSAADGDVWAGTDSSGLEKIGNLGQKCIKFSPANALSGGTLTMYCFYKTPAGDVLMGTGSGVSEIQPDRYGSVALPGTDKLKRVKAITCDPSGALWLGDSDQGFFRYSSNRLEAMLPLQIERGTQGAAACTDAAGRVWLCRFNMTENGSLGCYENGQFRWYTAQDGLFSGGVRILMNDSNGQVWAAGRGGLSRFSNGRFQTLTRRNGLPDDDIFALLQDHSGYFWIASGSGLFRVNHSELERACDNNSSKITGEQFGREDGLRGFIRGLAVNTGGRAGATVDTDGRFWFATSEGLAVLDPAHIPLSPLAPKVHIEQVIASGKSYPALDHLELPIGTRSCEFDYVCLSFISPAKVRYQCRLDGSEVNWTDAGAGRQAFYSNLKPGKYIFHVRACNNDGVWNEAGAAIPFSIAPSLYETPWFIALITAVAGLALFGLHRLRVARLAASMRLQLEAQVKERKRIAQELHDTLLQGFTGLGLKFDALANSLPPAMEIVKTQIQKLLDQSDQYLTEARRSVWELRSATLESHEDLSRALPKAVERALEGTGVELYFSVAGTARMLDKTVENNLLRICEEATANAVKHGHPTRIEVILEFKPEEVVLLIRDNGNGFDLKTLERSKDGHFGLSGMKERAESMSGKLILNSQPGRGTELFVTARA